MFIFKRSAENPILVPDSDLFWEAEGTFNGCPVKDKNGKIHFLYRAISSQKQQRGLWMKVSSIGYTSSRDGLHFKGKKLLLSPELDFEQFGCEDPRVTRINGKYYIFYTALSQFPFRADGIKIAVAVTKDFKKFAKHLVTPFNAKAMVLFPQKVNGKFTALLTVHTDMPPAKICVAQFDREDDLWSEEYWRDWYSHWQSFELPLRRYPDDHVEVGAPPVKTKNGWLFFYSSAQNYFSPPATFSVEAAILDLKNPMNVIAQSARPLLVPQEEYDQYGAVPRIVFPTGALRQKKDIWLYYGAADTTCAVAAGSLSQLLEELIRGKKKTLIK